MISKLLSDAKLFYLLYLIDLDLAEQCRKLRCPYCGSVLHFARYTRKPRGGPNNLPDEYMIRHGLCCSAENCRRRTLPASCLFMGRRVYWRCVILVVMALHQQRPKGASIYRLRKMFDIDHKTIRRWLAYFRQVFPSSAKWKSLRGLVGPKLNERRLPGSLLVYFSKQTENQIEALVACLRFLAAFAVFEAQKSSRKRW
jgi:hypothetical protein